MQVSVPTLVHQSFTGGPAQLGAALAALAAGSLTGTLVCAARGMPGQRALPLATAIMTCGLAATAIAPVLPAALAGLAIIGLGWSCFLGTTIATLQSADPRMLGRVMSLFALVLLGGTSAGAPAASALAASLGPRAPFFTGTAAAIAALAVAVSSTRTTAARPLPCPETVALPPISAAKYGSRSSAGDPGGDCPATQIATDNTWPTSHTPSSALRIFTAPDPPYLVAPAGGRLSA